VSFTNFGGDPEQYFSARITEDIITELSRFRQSFMIARNSSLEFRRPTVNLADDRRRLGAVRITAQLIGVRSAQRWNETSTTWCIYFLVESSSGGDSS
jgi:TolB-like protein